MTSKNSNILNWIDSQRLWLWVFFCLLLLFFFYPIVWRTNDDVGMMMYVNGFGLSPYSTSHLIFSTSIWGTLMQAVPNFGSITGYAATILALAILSIIFIANILKSQLVLDAGDVFAVIMLLASAVSTPQFSITSGFCASAGMFGLFHFLRQKQVKYLVWSCCFCLFAFLIRPLEAVFIFIICTPFVFKEILCASRKIQVVLISFVLAIASLWVFDSFYSKDNEWSQFSYFEKIRPAFSDFGVAEAAARDPHFTEKTKYSANDLKLLSNWFFLNSDLHDVKRLSSVIQIYQSEVRFQPKLGWHSVRNYLSFSYYWYFILIIVCLCGVKEGFRLRGFLAFLFVIALIFVVGAVSKAVPWRVYFPSYLCFFAFLMYHQSPRWRTVRSAIFGFLFVLFVYDLYDELPQRRYFSLQAQADLLSLPFDKIYFVWSDLMPYEYIYAPFQTSEEIKKYKIFSISSGSLRPPSFKLLQNEGYANFDQAVSSGKPLSFIMTETELRYLVTYCSEHLRSKLILSNKVEKKTFKVFELSCKP